MLIYASIVNKEISRDPNRKGSVFVHVCVRVCVCVCVCVCVSL